MSSPVQRAPLIPSPPSTVNAPESVPTDMALPRTCTLLVPVPMNTMGVLGEYLFEEITDSAVETVGHEGGDTITGNEVIPDTSFHLRSIFWDEKTIGFTFLILGKFINLLVFFCYYNFVLFHIV
jgi:hypothetical protein